MCGVEAAPDLAKRPQLRSLLRCFPVVGLLDLLRPTTSVERRTDRDFVSSFVLYARRSAFSIWTRTAASTSRPTCSRSVYLRVDKGVLKDGLIAV
jgi:hypothetical protein